MLVDDDVFWLMEQTKWQAQPIAVPGVDAMIALKLHAAQQRARTEAERDWSDVIALIKAHKRALDDVDFRAMILRHGGNAAIDRLTDALADGDEAPLR